MQSVYSPAVQRIEGHSLDPALPYESIERIEGAKHFVPEDHLEEAAAAVKELLKHT